MSAFLMWKSIYGQIDSLGLAPYLTTDESSYRFQILDRVMSAFHNGMPPESAQYLLDNPHVSRRDGKPVTCVACIATLGGGTDAS